MELNLIHFKWGSRVNALPIKKHFSLGGFETARFSSYETLRHTLFESLLE